MERYILKPSFNNLTLQQLEYQDILTFVALRSFYNQQDQYCFPSQNTLSRVSGISKASLSKSLERLQKANYIGIWKVGKNRQFKHYYRFDKPMGYLKVPFSILNAIDLTTNEKAMLLLLREYTDESLKLASSIQEIADASGVSYRAINKQFLFLKDKGYIDEQIDIDETSLEINSNFYFSSKINWQFPNNPQPRLLAIESVKKEFDVNEILKMAGRILFEKGKRQLGI